MSIQSGFTMFYLHGPYEKPNWIPTGWLFSSRSHIHQSYPHDAPLSTYNQCIYIHIHTYVIILEYIDSWEFQTILTKMGILLNMHHSIYFSMVIPTFPER